MEDPVDILGIIGKYAYIRDFGAAEREIYGAYMAEARKYRG